MSLIGSFPKKYEKIALLITKYNRPHTGEFRIHQISYNSSLAYDSKWKLEELSDKLTNSEAFNIT